MSSVATYCCTSISTFIGYSRFWAYLLWCWPFSSHCRTFHLLLSSPYWDHSIVPHRSHALDGWGSFEPLSDSGCLNSSMTCLSWDHHSCFYRGASWGWQSIRWWWSCTRWYNSYGWLILFSIFMFFIFCFWILLSFFYFIFGYFANSALCFF